ncbi:putative Rho-GTPase-activating protein 7 [Dissostichus eleginoides]|uniref:Rho-GTPase-activating protein 7 n=1 Tax=Dissostichus eleginoides TaxID=100907 RepID=A0AAD9CFA8_DISEL|nr:putative Rho-GTPase-activating protein 7 [Dissostichus eleginoides]
MEPLRWPIAPDGYIPNSVIRSWSRNGKALNETGYLDDIFYSLQHCTTNDEEDESTRVFWLSDDEEEEEEEIKTDDVKERGKEKEDKKNEKGKVERHERAYENKEREEEHKKDGFDLLKPSYDIQTTLQNQQITSDEGQMNVEPQRQEVRSTYNSRKTVEKILLTCHDNGPKQLGEKREDFKPQETITAPLQYVSLPFREKASSFISKEPRITLNKPPTEPQNLTPHPLKPTPPTPEDPRPQPELGSPECPPIRDESFLPLTSRCKNVRDVVHLDRKALELFKKCKYGNKNLSHPGKYSTKTEQLSASKGTDSPVQTNTGGLYPRPEFQSKMSTIPTHPPSVSGLEGPSDQLFSDLSPQFEQTNLSMPEWRKNLYQRIALQGFCSPQGARLAAKEHPVKPSNARQPATIIPSLQPGQAAAHQRVVQKVQMKDTREPASFKDHYVIPMNSQQSFFTSNLSGKTQYGRLQFDWLSGHDEEKLLCACG